MEKMSDDFDLAPLLAPIAGESPAGADLREDRSPQSLYYRLRDARAEARAAERQSDTEQDAAAAPPPQWATIRKLAVEALVERSKDLEIATWYTEALLRSDGLRGFAAGCRLMAGLIEGFWDELYPPLDPNDPDARLAPVAGLNGEGRDGTLIQPLRKLVLFTRPDGAPLPVWRYAEAAEVSALGDAARKQRRLEAGALPFETVEEEARAVAGELARLRDAASAAGEAWQALAEALGSRAGADAVPSARVRELLEQIRDIAARYASAEAPAATGNAPPTEASGGTENPRAPALSAAAPAGREAALRQLEEIAAFFRRTEPHSPLSYTLQEAVRRARMSWPDLLAEVVPDPASRASILTGLGIKPPAEE